jgi:signal transduction histidine kinase
VSNAIAHDLRTPLGRIRSQLEEALRPGEPTAQLAAKARIAIMQIDELIGIFDRLLQIAEAESGTRRQSFSRVRLEAVVADIVELYDAEAEARGIALRSEPEGGATTLGDRNLLASAVANLIDNALKYAGSGATVRVRTICERDSVSLIVEDNGPGIPAADRSRVVERFYRADASRSMPGNGLGLPIVSSIASLHRGALRLDDAAPGLRASLIFPRAERAAAPSGGLPDRVAAHPEV